MSQSSRTYKVAVIASVPVELIVGIVSAPLAASFQKTAEVIKELEFTCVTFAHPLVAVVSVAFTFTWVACTTRTSFV
ncbi:MAG: hypothetical protein NWS15_05725, partial [Schleiferiaceae bacterium]|nr:hypothetical protein [Schleiferiaceae bacterium]